MKFARSAVLATALAAGCAFAQADTAPSATFATAGFTFQDYTSTTPVGDGKVDISNTLYYIDEQTVAGLQSWYIFFDPKGPQIVDATLNFTSPIVGLLTTKSELDSTNATYGNASITYDTSHYIGLENQDTAVVSNNGHTLTLHLAAIDPGDHLRVLVQPVPEPATYALFGMGALALAIARRKKKA